MLFHLHFVKWWCLYILFSVEVAVERLLELSDQSSHQATSHTPSPLAGWMTPTSTPVYNHTPSQLQPTPSWSAADESLWPDLNPSLNDKEVFPSLINEPHASIGNVPPGRSSTAPTPNWRTLNSNTQSNERSMAPTVLPRQRNIPRLQNRHLEVRGRPEQARIYKSKDQVASKPMAPSASSSGSKKKLIIIRGLPGSGKSTLARCVSVCVCVC